MELIITDICSSCAEEIYQYVELGWFHKDTNYNYCATPITVRMTVAKPTQKV